MAANAAQKVSGLIPVPGAIRALTNSCNGFATCNFPSVIRGDILVSRIDRFDAPRKAILIAITELHLPPLWLNLGRTGKRMKPEHVELWQRLDGFKLDDPGSALPFSARLARENNWSTAHTRRVISEYKRLAFLAIAAGHPVSPSEDVDQAWHLHLVYTQNYWQVFCAEILRCPLHHQPTQGGTAESEKFADWYRQTLESYRKFFGELPPADIWPTAEAHANEKHDFVRTDRLRHWILPRPNLGIASVGSAVPGLTLLALGGIGTLAFEPNPFNWQGPDFLVFYVILFPVCFLLGLRLRWQRRIPADTTNLDLSGLDGYPAAYLNGGPRLTVNAAIANLVRLGAVRVDVKRRRLIGLSPEPTLDDPLEQRIYDTAAKSTDGASVSHARVVANLAVASIAEGLQSRGLVMTRDAARRATTQPILVAALAIVIGVIKIVVGISRDRPVGYLTVLCLVSLLVSVFVLGRPPLRSRRGDVALDRLKQTWINRKLIKGNLSALPTAEFVTIVGVVGIAALAGTELAELHKSVLRENDGGSSGGCSGGGGGGCGGGGGGCGGCGGGH
jgi:uncharacterized protein (TIGR04222 family)